jgi:hypothetical protein
MTDNWTVNGNGNWTTGGDWSDGTPPGTTEAAFVGTNSGSAAVTLTFGSFTSLTVASIGTSFLDTIIINNNTNFTASLGTGSSANSGVIEVVNFAGLTIGTGDFDNLGQVSLEVGGTDFASGGNVELTGAGSILMSGTGNTIQGASPTDEITNEDNNISGAGIIDDVAFLNNTNGVISGFGGNFDNAGEMLVDDDGIMVLGAASTSSTIGLESSGVIQLTAGSHITELEVAGNVTINSVGGQIEMQGGVPSNDYFVSDGAACSLDLDGCTVSGAGTLGDANMTLTIESGTIVDANNGAGSSGNTTLIVTTGGNTITNNGMLEATSGGTMDIRSAVNDSGTVAATSGGTLIVEAAVTGSGSVAVGNGSMLNVTSGGVVSGLIIDDPSDPNVSAVATIQSVGTVNGLTKIDGGQLILDVGATFEPNARLTITHAGRLVLEQDSFAGTIRGFAGQDALDLSGIRFIGQGPTATTATYSNGYLQVAGGNRAIDLHMPGNYTSANFAVQNDGAHGTYVTFVP